MKAILLDNTHALICSWNQPELSNNMFMLKETTWTSTGFEFTGNLPIIFLTHYEPLRKTS